MKNIKPTLSFSRFMSSLQKQGSDSRLRANDSICGYDAQRGQTALVALLTVGVIVLVIGVSVAARGSIAAQSGRRATLTTDAYYNAQAGANDALIKLGRNKEFLTSSDSDNGTNCSATDVNSRNEYGINFGTSSSVCIEVKATVNSKERIITARGIRENNTRTLEVKADVTCASGDSNSSCVGTTDAGIDPGKITINSYLEL